MTDDRVGSPRRRGDLTRTRAQSAALRLFTEQGYEATSMRQIAEQLGINKASLYYHFDGKEAIVRSLLDQRGDEVEGLLTWLREQPASPSLIVETVVRWVDTFTAEKLQGIRFLSANPLLLRDFAPDGGEPRVGTGLTRLADELGRLLPQPTDDDLVVLRMALLSVNAAVLAAAGSGLSDEAIVTAARRAARTLAESLVVERR